MAAKQIEQNQINDKEKEIIKFKNENLKAELDMLEINGEPYFVASKLAETLGYTNSRKAINDHCRYVTKCYVPHPQNPNKILEMNIIPESDFYRLVIHSKLPSAEKFEKWVMEEILPSIRQTGGYSIRQQPIKRTFIPSSGSPAEKLIDELAVAEALRIPEHARPFEVIKAVRIKTGEDYSYYLQYIPIQDNISDDEKMLEPTELGKILGISAQSLNLFLSNQDYQRKTDDGWQPTEEGRNYCYAHYWQKGNKSGYNLKWKVKAIKELWEEIHCDVI